MIAIDAPPLDQNSPMVSLRRHMSCCSTTLIVSFLPTRDNPNPAPLMREVLDRKVRRHICKVTHELDQPVISQPPRL